VPLAAQAESALVCALPLSRLVLLLLAARSK